jgi:hypothetical protein
VVIRVTGYQLTKGPNRLDKPSKSDKPVKYFVLSAVGDRYHLANSLAGPNEE